MNPRSAAKLRTVVSAAKRGATQGNTQMPPQHVKFEGQWCVIKWIQPKPWAAVRCWLAALGCALAFGERIAPASLRTGGIQAEAQRLRALRAVGRRVPQVLLQDRDYLVLSAVGTSLDRIVPQLTTAEKIALFEQVADDLADWHNHGHWHGGAQLRNVTLHQNTLYRIDFEERHGHVLSTAATRAYDMLLFFGDALARLDAAQAISQGERLMQRYLDQMPEAEQIALQKRLQRLRRWLAPLVWLDAHFPSLTRKRDKQRVVRFAKVVNQILPTLSGVSMPAARRQHRHPPLAVSPNAERQKSA